MTTQPTNLRDARIGRLRRQADHVHPVVAQAFRRRACELELTAWVRDVVTRPAAEPDLLPAA
jgi:hypothetical protein